MTFKKLENNVFDLEIFNSMRIQCIIKLLIRKNIITDKEIADMVEEELEK